MRQAAAAPAAAPERPAPPPAPAAGLSPLRGAPPIASAREAGFYAATRVGKKKVTASLAPVDHKRLRQLALERDATTEALLSEAISDLFAKYGMAEVGQGTGAS
jgi:hypothetical protein